jgi:uncharacterized protein YwgA
MGKSEVRWLLRLLRVTPKKLTKTTSFDERLKVQKAVFLLKYLKVEPFSSYGFGLYLHGPYSADLAKDYYDLGKVKPETVPVGSAHITLLRWFVSKDDRWLEVASSILSLRERYGAATDDEIYSTLRLSKPWVDKQLYESVTTDLVKHRLLSS